MVVVVAVAVVAEGEEVIGPWWVKGGNDLVPWAARILLRRGTGSSTTRFVYLTSTMNPNESSNVALPLFSFFLAIRAGKRRARDGYLNE